MVHPWLWKSHYGYSVSDESGHQKLNFLRTLSRVESLKNAVWTFRVDGKNQNFSKTMTSQYLIHATREKENGEIWGSYVYSLHKAAMKYTRIPKARAKLLW